MLVTLWGNRFSDFFVPPARLFSTLVYYCASDTVTCCFFWRCASQAQSTNVFLHYQRWAQKDSSRVCMSKLWPFAWAANFLSLLVDAAGTRKVFCAIWLTLWRKITALFDFLGFQMILAGQRPEVVIEIASRALAFWHYQVSGQLQVQKVLYWQYTSCYC